MAERGLACDGVGGKEALRKPGSLFPLPTVIARRGPSSRSPPGPAPGAGPLWTTKRDGEVKLRLDESGIGAEDPITVHDLFLASVEKYGNFPALSWKKNGRWSQLTFRQYYGECRKTAKSFLKVWGGGELGRGVSTPCRFRFTTALRGREGGQAAAAWHQR